MIRNIQSIAKFVAVLRGKLRGGRIKGVFIQEINCDFAGPKRAGRNNGVAIFKFALLYTRYGGFGQREVSTRPFYSP